IVSDPAPGRRLGAAAGPETADFRLRAAFMLGALPAACSIGLFPVACSIRPVLRQSAGYRRPARRLTNIVVNDNIFCSRLIAVPASRQQGESKKANKNGHRL